METIYYIILAVIAVFIIGPAVLSSTTHVIVDFYADWCPPCRAIAPIFSQLADTHSAKGQLAFAKVNVDHVNDVAGRYSVSAMPTFVLFENGKPKAVAVEGIKGRQSVSFTEDGLVDRLRGADPVALKAVVAAMAAKVQGATGRQAGLDEKKE
ncbi:putative thioredoxin-like protein [Ilyonectria robusta]